MLKTSKVEFNYFTQWGEKVAILEKSGDEYICLVEDTSGEKNTITLSEREIFKEKPIWVIFTRDKNGTYEVEEFENQEEMYDRSEELYEDSIPHMYGKLEN